jgi:TAG lipase/steryl ester hydrolase/phospholipase A2/LPA acyltransferase
MQLLAILICFPWPAFTGPESHQAATLGSKACGVTMKKALRSLEKSIEHAETYAEWREACQEHDRLSGADEWKAIDRSPDYDYELIRNRLAQIRQARERNDVNKLVFHLHEGLHGNLGNISNPRLYQHALIGTKRLIENYIDEVCRALDYLCDNDFEGFPFKEKLDFFQTTGQAFGQSCLMLSGGGSLGLFHIGVVKALWEEDLLPSVISGSSAGSIITSVAGTNSDADLRAKLEPENLYLEAFKYIGWSGVLKGTPVLDGDHLEACLEENIPDMTFEEAYRKTGREINITASPYDRHQHSRLLNWRTSPNVLIRKASLASCAIPGIYPPVALWAKNIEGEKVPYIPGRKFVDGSIKDDLPIRRLSRLYGVNHSIVSQTNPHVVPFLSRRGHSGGLMPTMTDWAVRNLSMNLRYGLGVLQRYVRSNDLGLVLDKVESIVHQKYVGDINIIPPRQPLSALKVLRNPTLADVRTYIRQGEKSTWPRLDMVRNTTRISRTFRNCLNRLDEMEARKLDGLKLVEPS